MTLPIGDVNPTRRTPWVTITLIAVNVLVFALVRPVDECQALAVVYRFGGVPEELLRLDALTRQELPQLLDTCSTAAGSKSVLFSILSLMFLHGGLMHLGGNMLFLWVFGNNVEDHFGRGRFLAFYLLGGVLATYGFALAHPDLIGPMIGASGAVAAVLGAYLLTFPRARVHTIMPFPFWPLGYAIPGWKVRAPFLIAAVVTIPAWFALGTWFILEGLSAPDTGSGVAVEAHVAGFAAGVVLTLLLDDERRRELLHAP